MVDGESAAAPHGAIKLADFASPAAATSSRTSVQHSDREQHQDPQHCVRVLPEIEETLLALPPVVSRGQGIRKDEEEWVVMRKTPLILSMKQRGYS